MFDLAFNSHSTHQMQLTAMALSQFNCVASVNQNETLIYETYDGSLKSKDSI